MRTFTGSATVLLCLALPPLHAVAADGTIQFTGGIVESTMSRQPPVDGLAAHPDQLPPQHTVSEDALPRHDIELLNYFATYHHEQGVSASRLRLRTLDYD